MDKAIKMEWDDIAKAVGAFITAIGSSRVAYVFGRRRAEPQAQEWQSLRDELHLQQKALMADINGLHDKMNRINDYVQRHESRWGSHETAMQLTNDRIARLEVDIRGRE